MTSIADALRILLTGVSYGMILFLIASGLSLILGVMGILNLAHGSLYMLGAYIGLAVSASTGNFWIGALAGGAAVGVIGLLLERGFLRRLYRQFNDQVLLTLGFVYIFGNGAAWLWGSFPKLGKAPAELSASIPMGDLNFPVYRLALIVIGLAVAGALWWMQNRTRVGAIVRAGMDDREMVLGLGINFRLVSTGVFFMGAFVAGLAGFLGTPIQGASSELGFPILIQALIVVIVGGVGRVEGTLLGALVIGLMDSLGKTFFPQFSSFTIYVVFILILLFRPTGLLGRTQVGSAIPPSTDFRAAWRGIPRQFSGALGNVQRFLATFGPYLVLAIGLLVLPALASSYLLTTVSQIFIYAIFALSLNLLFGYTGMFSLGHAAYFGVAAYVTAYVSVALHVHSFWVLLFDGVLAATVTAAIFGIIALRVSGTYFLFVTLALGELLVAVANSWTKVTGGSQGIYGILYPDLGLAIKMGPKPYYYVLLVAFVICATLLYVIVKSPFGLALQGIRDDEGRMKHLGYQTWLFKYLAFVIAGAFAGVAGVLFAPATSTVVPPYLGTTISALVMLMIILGSSRVFGGPIIGAAVVLLLQNYIILLTPERWPLILGVIFVLSVMFLRGGVGIYVIRALDRLRLRPAPPPIAHDDEPSTLSPIAALPEAN